LPVDVVKGSMEAFSVDSYSLVLSVSTSVFVVIVLNLPFELWTSLLLLNKNWSDLDGWFNIVSIPSDRVEPDQQAI